MPETVIISYRGANYAIGQGQLYYGIWPSAAPQGQPIEWWQHTPEGWSAAWARFTSLEVPGTIGPVTAAPAAGPAPATAALPGNQASTGQAGAFPAGESPATGGPAAYGPAAVSPAGDSPAGRPVSAVVAAGLLAIGVVVGIAGLFPHYLGGSSLASVAADVVPHAIYLAAWTLSAVLIWAGGSRRQVGALIGLGTSVVTFGLFLADVGTPIAGGASLMGAGLVLGVASWVVCTAGVVASFRSGLSVRQALTVGGSAGPQAVPAGYGSRPQRPRRFSSHEIVPMMTLVLAAVGAAIAFAPSWDRFTLQTSIGGAQTITEGNAFSNPGPVIFGDVVVMLAFVAVIVVAAFWRPTRLGAALAAGAVIPLVAQAISAVVQVQTPATPGQFGISSAQASALGLTIDSGLTAMFWVYCAFLGTLILLGIWMVLAPATMQDRHQHQQFWAQPSWAGPPAAAGPAGQVAGFATPAEASGSASRPGGTDPSGEAQLGAGAEPATQQ